MTGPLLETKLHVPRGTRGLVPRPRLRERLGTGAGSALTLISAPAGFGKTTLLTEWLAAVPSDGPSAAWLSLDEADNDPALFSRILKGEWTKLRTLPSTWRTAAFALVFSIGTGAILVSSQASQWASMTPAQRATFDATSCSLFGIMIAAVLLGALAARSVTAEYASGMIRSTFTAMPARRLVLAGKAATVAAFAFPVALVSNVIAFEIGQRIFAAKHLQVTLGHPGVLGAIVFGAVAVSLIAVLGVGLGGVIRHTAGATTAMAVVIVGGVTFGQLLPAGLRGYLPGTAIQAAVTVHRSPGILAPGTAIVVLGVYAAITLAAASIRAAHRDA